MRHETLKENLSAYLDGELSGPEKSEVEAHLKGCAECRGELESLRRANAEFKAHGARRAPEDLKQGILRQAGQKEERVLSFAIAAAVVVLVLLCVGTMFKPQISQMFNQIMAMVSGAASSVSSGN